MKLLMIHADYLEYEVKKKATKIAEDVPDGFTGDRMEEGLAVFIAVEKGDANDTAAVVTKALAAINDHAEKVGAERIMLYPYAHLSSNLAGPEDAMGILDDLTKAAGEEGLEVKKAPFGWYKGFKLSCKGHPLSELSREIKAVGGDEGVEAKQDNIDKGFKIVTNDGKFSEVQDFDFGKCDENFKIMVDKEALGKSLKGTTQEPRYISFCKKFGVDWERMSDVGHMRYGPKAAMIFELISDYSYEVSRDLGLPVYSVKGTNMFNLKEKAVSEHAELFGDRLYQLEMEGRKLVMRYAACHQQFAMIRDWTISYKNMPFAAFEVADSYRFEQRGETALCFRPRKFFMPDTHVFCRDIEEAKEWFTNVHDKIIEEARKLGREYLLLINTTSKDFIEGNVDFVTALLDKNPALICFYPPGKNYYWNINIEYMMIDALKRPREIGTVQIDVGNSERFGITYIDEKGERQHPIILHTAVIGSIERYMYVLFDNAVLDEMKGKKASLPLWLSPTQLRLMPVSRDQIGYCEELAGRFEGVRVDIDDTDETLGKKIRNAEKDWIPYIAVIGQKEVESGQLTVRIRNGEQKSFTPENLQDEIAGKTKGMPFRKSTLPRHISKMPIF